MTTHTFPWTVESLDEVGRLPLAARLLFLPSIATLLDDASARPALRRAACVALTGAGGRRSIELFVGLLDDEDPSVVEAGIRALGGAEATAGVFALYHPRRDVRLRALAIAASTVSAAVLVPLLTEGDHRAQVLALWAEHANDRVDIVPVVLRAWRRGFLSRSEAQTVVVRVGWRNIARVIEALPCAPVKTIVTADEIRTALAVAGDDMLFDLVSLIADDAAAIDQIWRATRARELTPAALQRLALAIVGWTFVQGGVAPRALALAAQGTPAVLGLDEISLRVRKLAARHLVDDGLPTHPAPFAVLCGAADSLDLRAASDVLSFGGETAGIDAAVLAGVLQLVSERPYASLLSLAAPEFIAAAFWAQPKDATGLWHRPPTSSADREAFLLLLAALKAAGITRAEGVQPSVLASLVVGLPHDGAGFTRSIEQFGPGTALSTALAIADAAWPADDATRLRLERSTRLLVQQLDDRGIAALVRACAGTLMTPATRALAQAIGDTCPTELIGELVEAWSAEHLADLESVLVAMLRGLAPSRRADLVARLVRSPRGAVRALASRAGAPIQPRPLTQTEVTAIVAASPAELAVALSVAFREPVTGVLQAVKRRSVALVAGDVRSAAALLCAFDPPREVADCFRTLLPTPTARQLSEVEGMLASDATDDLPLLARAFVCSSPIDALQFEAALMHVPGGVKGLLDLALLLPSGVLCFCVWRAAWFTLQRWRFQRPEQFRRCFDHRLEALLHAVAAGSTVATSGEPGLRMDDSLQALAQQMLALRQDGSVGVQPAAAAAAATTASVVRSPSSEEPKPDAAIVDGAVFWARDARADDVASLLHERSEDTRRNLIEGALLVGGVAPTLICAALGTLPPTTREAVVMEALRVVPEPDDTLLAALPASTSSHSKLVQVRREQLREACAWGVQQSRRLLAKPVGVSFIAAGLGWTRLQSSTIHVNPLPVLLGDPDGAAVVRGLMIHEIGHHLYHADNIALGIWDEARKTGLQKLLNLVADEHLERNLRARSARYGDPLKTLAAWAFQHLQKDMEIEPLIEGLGRHAFAALTSKRLGVARRPGAVRVDVGGVLRRLEKEGQSFARFLRALRMGLGDRHGDQKVQAALALFRGARGAPGFRASSMPRLLEIARELKRIFGDETRLLDAVDLHALLDASAADVRGDAQVDDGTLERHLNEARPPAAAPVTSSPAARPTRIGSGGTAKNEEEDSSFERITEVVRLSRDPAAHAALAAQSARTSRRLRRTLQRLGSGVAVERRRLIGARVDGPALVNAIIRGDPHVLRRRRATRLADLFLGLVVDCSGSMEGELIEKAKMFAVMVAEAARHVPGVELRVFGFTDQTLFDAGDARRCAAASLECDGGNNDAAALEHMARLARASHRRTRIIVMISDGLPTECSEAALRGLVQQLTRRGYLLTQVAVQPIEFPCFPHYVELLDSELTAAARSFASLIEGMVIRGSKMSGRGGRA